MTDDPIEEIEIESADSKQLKAENMLASIKSGWSLGISRIRPGWCSGYLERVECTENEPIDMTYIIEQWGGHILRLRLCDERGKYRGGTDLNLQSYPPKHEGEIRFKNKKEEPVIPVPQVPLPLVPVPPVVQPQQPNLMDLIGLLQKTRAQDLSTLRSLLDQAQPQPQHVQQQLGGIDEMIGFASKFKQLQELMGGQAPETQSEDGLMGSLGEVLKMFNQPKPAAQPVQARIIPPAPPQRNPQPPTVPSAPSQTELPNVLARLDVEDFKKTLLTSLSQMDNDKRNEIIAGFMDDGLDDFEEDFEDEETDPNT